VGAVAAFLSGLSSLLGGVAVDLSLNGGICSDLSCSRGNGVRDDEAEHATIPSPSTIPTFFSANMISAGCMAGSMRPPIVHPVLVVATTSA
jgi:hypothetical protein